MDIRQVMKRKSISDSRSAENLSDRRLRIEVRPAQTFPPWKSFCWRPWMHWFRSNSWVI